jgi:hypothetical protein
MLYVTFVAHAKLCKIMVVELSGTETATPGGVVKSVYEILIAFKPVLTLVA